MQRNTNNAERKVSDLGQSATTYSITSDIASYRVPSAAPAEGTL